MSQPITAAPADAAAHNWVDRFAPPASRPYLRLARIDRPIGTWLLLWPCWWSLGLAAGPGQWPDPLLIVLFGIGALVMRGAGCTLNDIADRDFDGRVERTRNRPIPSGQVSLVAAFGWMGLLAAIGFAILISFNPFAVWLGVASLAVVAIYPFMKRYTYWPQFFLGLAFNWGALLGWAAVRGELDLAPALLYAGGICWTLGYDTIYAHQDKEDDQLIGVKSTALRLGARTKPWLFAFYGLAIAGFGAAGTLAGLAWPFYVGLAAGAAQLAWQAATVDTENGPDCLAKFKSNNRPFGLILFAGIVAGQVMG